MSSVAKPTPRPTHGAARRGVIKADDLATAITFVARVMLLLSVVVGAAPFSLARSTLALAPGDDIGNVMMGLNDVVV